MVVPAPVSLPVERLICRCLRVSEADIRRALEDLGVGSLRELCAKTGAGGGCCACRRNLKELLAARAADVEPNVRRVRLDAAH